jgi:hypothetical protein
LLWRSQGVELRALGIVGHKDPPDGWRPAGRYAGCTVIDGFYVLANSDTPYRTDHVARVECPHLARRHRVAVIDVNTQRVVAHGAYWIGDPPRGFLW